MQTTSHALFAVWTYLRILDFEFCFVGGQGSSICVVVWMVFGREEGREVLDEESLV